MSCPNLEADLAAYAGGDLPARRMARIESHLSGCADCRTLAEELRGGRELLGELREEPLDDATVAQVRRRILARVTAEEAHGALPYWKLALAAALVLAAILWLPWRSSKPVGMAKQAAPDRVAPALAPAPAPRMPAVPVRRRLRRRRPPSRPPLLVHFVTDDPNIVIYWLVDRKPQGD